MKNVLVVCLALFAVGAHAAPEKNPNLSASVFDFYAPIVSDRNALTDQSQFGSIVYDATDEGFYGLDNGGTWKNLSSPTIVNPLTSGQPMKVFSARLLNTSGTCTVANESGDWINGTPSQSATGQCYVTFVTDTFTNTPTCVCTAFDGTGGSSSCHIRDTATPNNTHLLLQTFESDGTVVDKAVSVICMGQ